ncbi:Glucanosyltransferase-domain-containing protein [Lipomyces oligophaga]|uniref:Glucanosyltransferase-domain-containing protein n=1 Tax=Lipomyces oligophaga TaxID=45792 RepID=UPI0034CD1CA9
MRFSNLLLTLGLASSVLGATLNAKKIDGRYFVDEETNDPFWMVGVDYQPGGSSGFSDGSDPLSEVEACARDIYLFQQLGINTIRVYSVDPTIDHDECMSLLAAAGIYLVLDVNTGIYSQSLNSDEPWTTYTETYLSHIFQVIEAFSGYNNTLGFFAGNEVVNDNTSAETAPHYIKAVVRDMKAYIKNHINRQIPVGYSATDDASYRVSLADYLVAGDEDVAVDFYGMNSYEWCGDSSFTESGYSNLVKYFSNLTVPVFFSEYGCNKVTPRTFQEMTAIYSNNMSSVFSGGLVYEFTAESSDYGLVTIGDDGSATTGDDYDTYSSRIAQINTATMTTAAASTRSTSYAAEYYNIDGNTTLPDTLAASLIENGLDSSYNRGQWIDINTTATNYSITLSGTDVSDKTINQTYSISESSEDAIDITDSTTPSSASGASATESSSDSSSTGGSDSSASSTDSSDSTATSSSSSSSSTTTSSSAAMANMVDASKKIGITALLAAIVGVAL